MNGNGKGPQGRAAFEEAFAGGVPGVGGMVMIKRFVGRAAWKKRALDAEAGLRDIRACQERRLPSVKGVIGPRWGYHDAEGKLVEVVTANSWKAYGDHPICEVLSWVARALRAEVLLRDFGDSQSKSARMDQEAKELKGKLDNANRWSSVQDEAREYWIQRARGAEAERDKARQWANKLYGVSLALRKMVCGSGEPTDRSEPKAPGWQEHLQYIVDAAVCTFSEIALDKWGVCISLILEALDAQCENKTAFRALIEGVRDDIDHRLQYGRW